MKKSPELRMLEFIRKHRLADNGDHVLLAVSGGLDSMMMACLFSETKLSFGVAHVNFNLRGTDSAKDALFVESWCKKNKRPYFELNANAASYARKHRKSVQEAAREIRYQWFEEIAEEHDYSKIATAHHFDDSIETFFINLLRGTGIRGLSGIPLKNGRLIRPLLFASCAELEGWVKKFRLKFRNDASNQSDDYLRNRIRHHLIPLLAELQPAFRTIMERNLENNRFSSSLYEERLGQQVKKLVNKSGSHYEISIPDLEQLELPELLLREVINSLGGSLREPDKVLQAVQPGKTFDCGELTITRDRQKLVISKKATVTELNITIKKNDKKIVTPFGTLELKEAPYRKNQPLPAGPNELAIDASRISFPLVLRTWQTGERFIPLGMNKPVKVSDFLTGRKVPLPVKKQTLVLVARKEILCILGHRQGELFKVTPATRRLLLINWQPAT